MPARDWPYRARPTIRFTRWQLGKGKGKGVRTFFCEAKIVLTPFVFLCIDPLCILQLEHVMRLAKARALLALPIVDRQPSNAAELADIVRD